MVAPRPKDHEFHEGGPPRPDDKLQGFELVVGWCFVERAIPPIPVFPSVEDGGGPLPGGEVNSESRELSIAWNNFRLDPAVVAERGCETAPNSRAVYPSEDAAQRKKFATAPLWR